MMTPHRPKEICSVNNIRSLDSRMSSKLPSATSTKFFAQQVLTIAHVDVSMNLNMRQHVSNNMKKIQIIKMMALKRKMK